MNVTLKAARINKGLTQKQAAEIIGVTEDTISNWERGRSYPKAPQISAIEKTYGCKYDDIIFLPMNYAKSVKRPKAS